MKGRHRQGLNTEYRVVVFQKNRDITASNAGTRNIITRDPEHQRVVCVWTDQQVTRIRRSGLPRMSSAGVGEDKRSPEKILRIVWMFMRILSYPMSQPSISMSRLLPSRQNPGRLRLNFGN
jgi:hypothetical protein